MISIIIPTHNMANAKFFLKRSLDALAEQTYQDFEIIIPDNSHHFTRTEIDEMLKGYHFNVNRFINENIGMAQNTNAGIVAAKGELIKILYMDDYLAHKDSLKNIVDGFTGNWLVTGCDNDKGTGLHYPTYNDQIYTGNNTIGSPSVLTIKNDNPLLFDEEMTWLLDCDYYKRLYEKYGEPTILNDINVIIGIGEHQITNKLSQKQKDDEGEYIKKKYE